MEFEPGVKKRMMDHCGTDVNTVIKMKIRSDMISNVVMIL